MFEKLKKQDNKGKESAATNGEFPCYPYTKLKISFDYINRQWMTYFHSSEFGDMHDYQSIGSDKDNDHEFIETMITTLKILQEKIKTKKHEKYSKIAECLTMSEAIELIRAKMETEEIMKKDIDPSAAKIKVLVCGGRNFGHSIRERLWIYGKLEEFSRNHSQFFNADDNWLPSDLTIITGGCCGVDVVARDWAITVWCEHKEFAADWKTYGKAAGPMRNQRMLDEGRPDFVIAFPGGSGTHDMIRRAEKAGIPIIKYAYTEEP